MTQKRELSRSRRNQPYSSACSISLIVQENLLQRRIRSLCTHWFDDLLIKGQRHIQLIDRRAILGAFLI